MQRLRAGGNEPRKRCGALASEPVGVGRSCGTRTWQRTGAGTHLEQSSRAAVYSRRASSQSWVAGWDLDGAETAGRQGPPPAPAISAPNQSSRPPGSAAETPPRPGAAASERVLRSSGACAMDQEVRRRAASSPAESITSSTCRLAPARSPSGCPRLCPRGSCRAGTLCA